MALTSPPREISSCVDGVAEEAPGKTARRDCSDLATKFVGARVVFTLT